MHQKMVIPALWQGGKKQTSQNLQVHLHNCGLPPNLACLRGCRKDVHVL